MQARSHTSSHWRKPLLAIALAMFAASCSALPPWVEERISEIRPTPDKTTSPSTPAQSPQTGEMEAQIYARINQIRQEQGLSELQPNEQLAAVARRYSQQMADENFFSHTSPDGVTPAERVRSAGIFYVLVGENLFMGTNLTQPVNSAVTGWMNSPGHRENLLRSQYRETGIGVWQVGETYYITQLFLRSIQL